MEKDIEKKSDGTTVAKNNKIVTYFKSLWQYLHEVWVEVRPNNGRVTWPTWESVRITTRVVIISSIGLGVFIVLCDVLFSYIFQTIAKGIG